MELCGSYRSSLHQTSSAVKLRPSSLPYLSFSLLRRGVSPAASRANLLRAALLLLLLLLRLLEGFRRRLSRLDGSGWQQLGKEGECVIEGWMSLSVLDRQAFLLGLVVLVRVIPIPIPHSDLQEQSGQEISDEYCGIVILDSQFHTTTTHFSADARYGI